MSLDVRMRTPFEPELQLPPPFRLVSLREIGDAFAHAQKIAPEAGAGALVWVGRFDIVEFAVVLEPEEPLASARRAFYVGMAGLVDALAAHAPPEKPIRIEWPDAIRVDGGLVGGGRLAWPKRAREDSVPAWLVFGAMIRTVEMAERKPGVVPLGAALEEEGFHDLGLGRLVESFARHLLKWMDAWQEEGFQAVAQSYLSRLAGERGVERSIDPNANLLVRTSLRSEIQTFPLVPALAAPSWLDPQTGVPRG